MATSADCPSVYDVVINGQGYMLDKSYDDSPYRTPPAEYSATPTFLERSNVGTAYGDDQQDFFLIESQNDWSGGEGRAFFRPSDPASVNRFERSHDVESNASGVLFLQPDKVSYGGSLHGIIAACAAGALSGSSVQYYVDSTTLYTTDYNGNVQSLGAHGAGTPAQWGLATDGVYVYISGATKLRKWNIATPAFSDFGTNAAMGALCFTGNLLYANDGSVLRSFSGAGVATTIFTWKDATGTALVPFAQAPKIMAFGGHVLSFFPYMTTGPELWTYDGTNTNISAHLPAGAVGYDMVELDGTVYLSGVVVGPNKVTYQTNSLDNGSVPTIWSFSGGSLEVAWQDTTIASLTNVSLNDPVLPPLGTFRDGIVFQGTTDAVPCLKLYTPSTGVVMTLTKISVGSAGLGTRQITSGSMGIVFSGKATDVEAVIYPKQGSLATVSSGILYQSRFDFDNSLQKVFRSVKVDWTKFPGDSGAPTVTVAIEVDDDNSLSYSISAVAGQEMLLPNNTFIGRSCQVWVILNKGTSTRGPIVRRVYVRASPILQSYKQRQYLLDLVGNKKANPSQYLTLVNGQPHTKDGDEMRADLLTAIAAGPISITDRFGTFTGIIEPAQTIFKEVRADYGRAEYRALVVIREI